MMLIAAALIYAHGLALAPQSQSDENQARAVIEQFCRLEAKGAGLGSDSPATVALFALTVGDEDGADVNKTLVSGFRIDWVRTQGDRMLARVVYHVVGSMDDGSVLHARDEDVPHTYELRKTKEGWRVAASTIDWMFHMSPQSLLRYYETKVIPTWRQEAAKSEDLRQEYARVLAGAEQLRALVKRLERADKIPRKVA